MAAADWLRGRPDDELVNFKLRPRAARPQPRRGARHAPATSGTRTTTTSGSRTSARSPPAATRGADGDGRARPTIPIRAPASSPPTCSASSERRAALPSEQERRAGGDGRARAGPGGAGRDRLRLRPPRRRRTATTGCSACAPTRTPTCARRSPSRSAAAPPPSDALHALIALSADENAAVRDWATFALGTLAASDSERCAKRSRPASTTPTRTPASKPSTASPCAATRARKRRAAELLAHDRGDSGVWRRHLLAETAEHSTALERPRGAS